MAKTSLGLDENVEGLLCYLGGWVTGLIFFLLEKESKFVKFHAMQSLITFAILMILPFPFRLLPFVGMWYIFYPISLLTFVLWIVLMVKAYKGEKFKLPLVGDIAEKQSA